MPGAPLDSLSSARECSLVRDDSQRKAIWMKRRLV